MERIFKLRFTTNSEAESARFGEALGRNIQSGYCISLVGALGTGKTVLAGAICRGMGVQEEVLSPTFVLYEEFQGRLPVVHIDLYRLEHESEIEELGVFDTLGSGKLILAEWGDRSPALLIESDIVIRLSSPLGAGADPRGTGRILEVSATAQAAPVFEGARKW
jgi:tRNA threonylcarbamoyladenosine biosynthesis protein TsaE